MLIDRDKVAAPSPLPREVVDVPELGGNVEVRGATLGERLRLQAMAHFNDGRLNIAELLAISVYASDEKPLWNAEQWDLWGEQGAAIRLFNIAARLNGFVKEDVEKKP